MTLGNGTPLAVMDSRDITSLRTAAATAVAAKYLARQDSRTVDDLWLRQIRDAFSSKRCRVSAISKTVFAYDKDEEQALRFAAELASDLKISVRPTV